jgi:hypothetical protein
MDRSFPVLAREADESGEFRSRAVDVVGNPLKN